MTTRHVTKAEKKRIYFSKLADYCETYEKVLIVQADNVGSRQMADIRVALRGKAHLLMGKNTMMRTALRQQVDKNPKLHGLINNIKLNIGLVFCEEEMTSIRELIETNQVPAPARAGALAPVDVDVPAGATSLGPEHTSFFQALGIGTKISKGMVEINQMTRVINKGERVGASQAALLQKLNIRPFSYGLVVERVYDGGDVYDAGVLDMSNEVVTGFFMRGVQNVAAVSRQVGLPTEASLPHSILGAFKNVMALVLDVEFSFPEVEQIKAYLKDPSAFASAAAPSAPPKGVEGGAGKKVEAVVEPEEEDDDDIGMSLFD